MPPRRNKQGKSNNVQSEAPVKASPASFTLTVPTLFYNKLKGSGNFSTWKEKLAIHVGSKYGRCQDLILTGTKHVPPAIPAPGVDDFEPANDPHGVLLKCYQKRETSRLQQILTMEEDYPKIYNEILATFSRESEEMVRQHTDFDAADAVKCPGLLLAIVAKTHQQPQSGAVAVDADTALSRFYELRQGNKSLPQHKKDFDDAVDMLVASGETKPADEKLAIRFIASLDPNRYAQWRVDLENDIKAGLDVMPKTLPTAYSRAFNLKKVIPNTHQPADASVLLTTGDKSKGKGKGKGKGDRESKAGDEDRKPSAHSSKDRGATKRTCHLCKQPGHYVSDCPVIKDESISKFIKDRMGSVGSTQSGVDAVHVGVRFSEGTRDSVMNSDYGTAGHVVLPTIGYLLDSDRYPSAIERTNGVSDSGGALTATFSSEGNIEFDDQPPALSDCDSDSDCDDESVIDEDMDDGVGAAMPTVDDRDLNDFMLLLDNQASMSVVRNPDLLSNIRPIDQPVRIDGIGGHLVISEVGDLPDFGTVYHHSDALANVLCFADVEDNGKILYSQRDSSFNVTIRGHRYQFKRVKSGGARKLYACDMRQHACERLGMVNVTTVSGNEALYTKREVGDARRARDLSRRLGYPSFGHMVKMVKNMENSPVRVADVHRAAKIWGPEIAYLKGTTRNVKTDHIPVDHIPRPPGRESQTLHVDLMYVEGEGFLYSKTTPLGLRMANHLGHGKGARGTSNIQPNLARQISHYTAAGFTIGTVLTDNEGGVMASVAAIQAKGIVVNPSSAGKHVPVIENDVKTLKSRVRTHIHALPFSLCRLLLVWLVLFCVNTLNMEPSSVNVDDYSPREVFLQRGINYKRDLRIGFGDYVQVQVPLDDYEKNKMHARTEGAIALCPTGNLQGSCKFLLLGSMRVVTRDQWVPLPMPPPVIDLLNKLAEKQPVSKDPKFNVGTQEIGEPEVEQPEAIRDGPLRVVPDEPLANPESEPSFSITSGAVVGDAATDVHPSSTPTVEPTVVDAVETVNQDTGADLDASSSHHQEEVQDHGVLETSDVVDQYTSSAVDQDQGDTLQQVAEPDPTYVPTNGREHLRRAKKQFTDYAEMQGKRWKSERRHGFHLRNRGVPERHYGFHITVNNALNKLGRTALYSMLDEMIQFHVKDVGKPIRKRDLTFKELKSAIRSSMFLKEKYLSTGEFEKLKARIVAGGHMQDRTLYDDVTSPTVATPAVFIAIAIAAREKRKVATVDIGGAYLNAEMGHHNVYMYLDPLLATLLSQIDAKYEQFVNDDGTIIVKLNKALYGCVQSSRLWYEHLVGTLEGMGFERNPMDKCVLNKVVDGKQCTVCVHVDDLLITCELDEVIDSIYGQLQERYKEVKIQRGPKVSYLGMTLDFSVPGKAKCTMEGYVADLLRIAGVSGKASTPALDDLFEIVDSPTLADELREDFHSTVAKLLYLAKRVRPDLLVSVSFLATRVREPTVQDKGKLDRVLKYLNGTADLGLTLEVGEAITVLGFVDASYGVHSDGKSHTGAAITLGLGVVFAKSSKQKLVSKSSTEAELIGLSDSASQIIWTREFLIGQGYHLDAATIYQDNMSTIAMVKKGHSSSDRSRHINIRYFFVKDRVDQGDVKIEYRPTGDMIADVLTKPLQGSLFVRMRDALLNCYVV